MWVVTILLGVGRFHPLVSLQFEVKMLIVKWEAIKRVIEFWVQVMKMGDDRMLKEVMLEALELGSKVRWDEKRRVAAEFGEVWVDIGFERFGLYSHFILYIHYIYIPHNTYGMYIHILMRQQERCLQKNSALSAEKHKGHSHYLLLADSLAPRPFTWVHMMASDTTLNFERVHFSRIHGCRYTLKVCVQV